MSKIIISCAPRVTSYVLQELKELGYHGKITNQLGVEMMGSMRDAMKLNLHLRTASKVLLQIKSFNASTPDELYQNLINIPWERTIPSTGYLRIESFVKNNKILDTRFANLKTKDAIVDRIMKQKGRRPNSGPKVDRTVVFLHWINNDVGIFINTSGDTISKHGYRKIPFKAPMMESLAAATILASEWNRTSHFINPMCGSGTLAIEAALIACSISPGTFRKNFGFMHVRSYDEFIWSKLVKESHAHIRRRLDFKIIATDIDPKAIDAAKRNAEAAGVAELIDFKVCDFRKTYIPKGKGVVFFNPEYGERLGVEKELEDVYRSIGDFFKQKCAGYMGYIFTGNMNLAKRVGLKTKRKIEFFNAKIDSRLLEYELYDGTKKG
ncbi:MAG: class I SAM-dependent RNA methyltransferase [Bacteroidota bacterium]